MYWKPDYEHPSQMAHPSQMDVIAGFYLY